MKNKEVQEQRIKGYFLQATKDLLKSEGLKSENVRAIADKAGYSYTTLYNYFKDINDLIFLCVQDFYNECLQHTRDQAKKQEKGIQRLKAGIKAYADFFIQYPGIFDLFFIEQLGSNKDKQNIAALISLSLNSICEEDWAYCVKKGLFRIEKVELAKGQLRHLVLGLLLLYLNKRVEYSYTEFSNQLHTQVTAIIEAALKTATDNTILPQTGDTSIHNSVISIKIGNNK
jgi:AcrR family transcriptional regulator